MFSSIMFLFLFFPLALAGYLLTPGKYRNLSLLLISLIFYESTQGWYVTVLLLCVAVNYCVGLGIEHFNRRTGVHVPGLVLLILSISVNLGALIYFKYAGFIVGNLDQIIESIRRLPIALYVPIGLSFLTFRVLSYIIDIYRGDTKCERSLIRFSTYVALFPLTLAGPIVRYRDVADQLVSREISVNKFAKGVRRFVIGLGKKVLVANTIAMVADPIFGLPANQLSMGVAWLGLVSYAILIYFDFSGYTDMAIGIGLMLGFVFPENFNYPYISKSIREFWRRWHITLSTWFRDYLYIPLGGNRVSEYRNYMNLVVVFVLCGLWHGANWTFIVWGLWHGIFLILERTRWGRLLASVGRPVAQFYALLIVTLGWVFFRSETLSQALAFFGALFSFTTGGTGNVTEFLNVKVVLVLIAGIVGSTPVAQMVSKLLLKYKANWSGIEGVAGPLIMSMDVAYVFIIMSLSVLSLASNTYNPFIYARF